MEFSKFSQIRSIDDIKSFFKRNKKILDYLEEYEQLDNFLGSGTKGKVWKIKGKELVLKITSDSDEIQVSKKLSGGRTEGFLKIFSTVEVGDYQLKIQELCYPVDNDFPYSPFYPHLYYELNKDTDLQNFKDFLTKKGKDPSQGSDKGYKEVLDLFRRVYTDCEKHGILSQYEYLDVHKDNVMQTSQGLLKLVDF